ncbi:hypothetical protein [Nafulsella turpanensis]|uniref:hypothetical protein n=1 Tax=Nafulsella turpanensis TaxID=1265690 RepID=UPI00034CC9F1|nr:hypothetical protein [Nafulsella turpanensis]
MKTFILFLLTLLTALPLLAQPTTLVVRAKAKDAKFIGSSIGGARIIVRDAISGEILAEGFTEGSTGNTQRIMKDPQLRHQPLSDAGTAGFTARLDLERPTFVTVEGYAPWQQPQAMAKVSSQLWLIPGKDITGDGLVLEFPGFAVNVLAPQTHERLTAGDSIAVVANVVMMCGCPLTEGGLWDASQYEVQALVSKDGEEMASIPLQQKNKLSTFSGLLPAKEPGLYQVQVYAYDPKTGNTGLATTNFIVE